jgi:site-specific recombinase XerD
LLIIEPYKEQQKQNKLLQPNDYVDEGYVFTHPDGRLISPNYITKHFRQLLERNNLEVIKFHDLCHSSASYLLYLGYNLKAISTWLGAW